MGHSFTYNIFITGSTTSGDKDPMLSQSVCQDFIEVAHLKCDYGGGWTLDAGPTDDGGDQITAVITVDPNANPC